MGMILDDPDNIKVDYDEKTRTLSADICIDQIFPFKHCETECTYKIIGYKPNYFYCTNSVVCRNAVDLFLRSKK